MRKKNQINTGKKGSLATGIMIIIATVLAVALLCTIALVIKSNANQATAKETRKENQEMLSDLEDIQLYLSTLEKTVTDNKSALENIRDESGGKSTEIINHQTETISGLTSSVGSLYEEIVSTKDDVSNLISLLNGNKEATAESIETGYSAIKSALESIDENYDHTLGSLESLVSGLSGRSDENYRDILKALSTVESDMKSQSGDSLNSIMTSLKNMETTYEKSINDQMNTLSTTFAGKLDNLYGNMSEMKDTINTTVNSKLDNMDQEVNGKIESLDTGLNGKIESLNTGLNGKIENLDTGLNGKIAQLDTSMNDRFDTMNSSLDEKMNSLNTSVNTSLENLTNTFNTQYQTFNTTISSDNEELLSTINTLYGDVNTRLAEVFQSASSGKSLLASTLTGYPEEYRVETQSDASFSTIKNNTDTAIEKAIAYGQSLTDSNNKVIIVPDGSSLTIRAHFHNVDGEACIVEFSSFEDYLSYRSSRGEVATSETEGGCYNQAHTYTYVSGTHSEDCNCRAKNHTCGYRLVDWTEWEPYYADFCIDCDHFCGSKTVTDYATGIDYYNTGCGYYDGEIISIDVRME